MPFPRKPFLPVAGLSLLLSVLTATAQTSGVLREVFYNIGGNAVANLTGSARYPNQPDEEFIESSFEAPTNFADNYGQRMRALITAPVTGSYVFWIASDDNSALYLSTDENPANKVLIASVPQWTSSREWNNLASQRSAPIALTGGVRYYLEALQKEGGGGDNLAVTWQKPGDAAPGNGAAPIAGAYLTPYGLGPPVVLVQPTNVSVIEGGTAVFSVQLSHHLGALFQWQRNGVNVPGATNSTFWFWPALLSESGAVFRCAITNSYGSTNSLAATLTVNPDVTRPAIAAVGNLGDARILTMVFTEPVEAASASVAGNYRIDNGITVQSASPGGDARTIILTTSPMSPGATYTLTINNVRDQAATPNVILPDSQRPFTLTVTPLDISFVRPPPEPAGPSSRHSPVVVSEIMFHPTNRMDGRNAEFIELFNSNPYFEDISGFRLTGGIDFTFPSNTVLAARAYLVVAAVPADVQTVYSLTNVFGPYTNRLSNGGETVRLLNRQGAVLFEVTFSGEPPWPAAPDGSGHSLILARPSLGEREPEAWAASDVMGGSPGRAESPGSNPFRTVLINEFLAHTDDPDVDFVELYNYGTQAVDLSGCVITDDPVTNRFVITGTTIPPQGFVSFNQTQLGFALNAAGETIHLIDPANARVVDAVRFAAQQNGVPTGRHPDGAAEFRRLQTKSPGSPNSPRLVSEVVINEIMYEPISGDADDEYVELYNRGSQTVDVGLWRFVDGIDYTLPRDTLIPPDGHLVIARNAARLLTNYPGLTSMTTFGDFGGSLANRGERLALAMPDEVLNTNAAHQVVTNTIFIVVDEVEYGTGGRWGQWSRAGGSSLELLDPEADHRRAPNWADSDESQKSGWVNIEFTGVLDHGNGAADSLQIILLGAGECLVDNVEVFRPSGANLIANPGFENGLSGWAVQGNHDDSSLETTEAYAGTRSLHLRATGRGDTGANRIRVPLTSSLSSGQTATLRAKVRWLAGNPEILLRLKGNWLEATGNILTARNLGTPGAPNSRSVANLGPAITGVTHSPAMPAANQSVTVVARVDDPDGLTSLVLKYRIDPSTNLTLVPLVNNGAGLFSAVIPGQASGRIAAFHLESLDNFVPRALSLFPGDAPARECLVRWGDPGQGGNFGTYRFWLSQTNYDRWSSREKLSNKPVDATFVYGNFRVIYNIGGQYSGSPYHAPGFNTPNGNVCDYVLNFPEDDLLLGETDFTLQWPGNGGGDNTYQREQTAYWIGEQIGLPRCYRRHVNLFVNGVRRGEMFEDSQQPNGDFVDGMWPDGQNGDLHKIQLWFEFDDSATGFTPVGATLQNFTTTGGAKKKARYRWNFARRAVQISASNYTNLFSLVDSVNFNGLGANYRRQLESQIDVENWLKTYAVEHIVGNNDSFAYGGGQNMYTYKPVGDTWKLVIWDIDFAFSSQGPTSGVFDGIGRSNGIDLAEPAYRRLYLQILQDLANGPLLASRANPLLDAKYNAMIASGRTVDNPSSIKTYISQRRTYLLNLIATNAPASFGLTLNGGADFNLDRNFVSLTGTAPVDVRRIVINGVVHPVSWTTVSNWVAQVVLGAGANLLAVQGQDALGNPVAGASDTININVTGVAEPPEGRLVINEIMYHPSAPDGSYVEIINFSPLSAFDLSGWRLDGAGFVFPPGTVVNPGGLLVVAGDRLAFAAAYSRTVMIAGEFSGTLQNNGETLRLVIPGATPEEDRIVDEVRYDSEPPWPAAADGTGAALQLIDPAQDNNRVGNWAAIATNAVPALARFTPGSGNSVRATLPPFPPIWLNEVQPGNSSGAMDRLGHRHPWAELFNGGATNVDLGGCFLANNYTNLTQWAFPAGTLVGPGQFLVVWLDGNPGESTTNEWHTGFTIPPNLGSLALVQVAGGRTNILDHLNYGSPGPDRSYGSWPDGTVSGRRVFHYSTPGGTNDPTSPPLNVVINEWMADNSSTLSDPADNDFEDWFELYNPGSTPADLSGFYLANSVTNRTQFRIPDGWTIPPQGYLLVWADSESSQNATNRIDLHVNFRLARAGDTIGLFAADGTIIDVATFGVQSDNVSEGSFPDGAAARYPLSAPTPRATNRLDTDNTPPVLAPIADQVLLEGQILVVTATATDTNLPLQGIVYSVGPGAPAGAAINPASGLFSWRPTAAQTATTNVISLLATDNGAPPMTGTTSFVVRVLPAPVFDSISRAPNGDAVLSFGTVAGKTYRVEYKDDLNELVWSALTADTMATTGTMTVLDPTAGGPQRFYRIAVLD